MPGEDLQQVRASFAREIKQQSDVKSRGLIEGLAAVARENFMGPGPWKIIRASDIAKGYTLTPDSDPKHLYQNVLVALDERRRLNNGEPLALLLFLDTLGLSAGDRFLHIGCGVGYYTAVAAHAVGAKGEVVAVEIDSALAARAKMNLRPYPTVKVVADNGSLGHFGSFDAIFVNAGCTRPQLFWLDQLAMGGRLLLPLTVSLPAMPGIGAGGMLLVTRGECGFSARFTSSVGIFHCEGARSADEEDLLDKALKGGDRGSVCRLRLDSHEAGTNCWLHTSTFCLESDPALRQERPTAVQVAPEILAKYVGRYQFAPKVLMTVTLEEGLFAQMEGQPRIPIYPESETKFFYESADVRITFVTDETGRATGLTLRHEGRDVPAQRVA